MHLRLAVVGLFSLAVGTWAQSGPQPFVIPEIKVRYLCEKTGRYWVSYGKNSKDRHYCWDGTHYSRAEGGVPAFVLDYWAQKEQERGQIRREIDERGGELRAQVAANQARLDADRRAMGLPTHEEIRRNPELARSVRMRPGPTGASPGVESSSRPKAQPVELALFDGLTAGIDRGEVVKRLGEPHGQIGNLGSDGDEESLTYLLAGGGQARLRLKGGKVVTLKLP
ncbi:hypothetical protein [Paludibaculum fermentans]|uniref:Uncharacterized protein n=1 Tax=Paludibaculum fermentans TaxID=1473598 RepID=A0A7S7NWW2_PALFE|nr:hypothetical protein [Paludibaculum fermentans]QOY91257.1 hypothetical protein IRI77_15300 [Paludibaculum fermentans]